MLNRLYCADVKGKGMVVAHLHSNDFPLLRRMKIHALDMANGAAPRCLVSVGVVVMTALLLRDGAVAPRSERIAYGSKSVVHDMSIAELLGLAPQDFVPGGPLPPACYPRLLDLARAAIHEFYAEEAPQPADGAARTRLLEEIAALCVRCGLRAPEVSIRLFRAVVEVRAKGDRLDADRTRLAERIASAFGLNAGRRATGQCIPEWDVKWEPKFVANEEIVRLAPMAGASAHESMDHRFRIQELSDSLLARPEVREILPALRSEFPRFAKALADEDQGRRAA